MYGFDIVVKENATDFFQKICLDNKPETDYSVEIEISPSFEVLPSFYEVNAKKKRGYKRTAVKNRFRGQRDGVYSERHDNRAFNKLCKDAVSESRSSAIKRGYNDYLDDIEDDKKKAEYEIAKKRYKTFLLEERNQAALTILVCSAKINAIDAKLASIDSE